MARRWLAACKASGLRQIVPLAVRTAANDKCPGFVAASRAPWGDRQFQVVVQMFVLERDLDVPAVHIPLSLHQKHSSRNNAQRPTLLTYGQFKT